MALQPHQFALPLQFTNRGFRLLRILLGVLLLASAGLKAHGLAFDPLSQDSFLASPRLLIASIEVETVLGLWLLSGWSQRAARLVALGFFGILAGVSLYLALVGQRSCGCFGRVPVNPWLTFTIDVAAVAALALMRPAPGVDERRPSAWLRGVLTAGLGAAVLLVLIGGTAILALGGPTEALARLRGEPITVEPAVSDLGDGVRGEERDFTIRLANHTGRSVRVVGGTASCQCVVTDDLPLIVPPGESRPLQIHMAFRGGSGRFQHRYILYTDDEHQPVITARFVGRVIEPPTP